MPNEQLFKGIDRLWRMGTVVPCKGIWIPESEYSLRNPKSHLPLKFRIRNPESQSHWLQRLESTTWNTESTAWNQESKNCLRSDSYPVASLYALWFMGKIERVRGASREGRKKNAKFLSLFLPPSQARQISVPYSFARINKWRLGTSLVLDSLTQGVNFA